MAMLDELAVSTAGGKKKGATDLALCAIFCGKKKRKKKKEGGALN